MAHELKYKLCYGITRLSSDQIFSPIEACEAGARTFYCLVTLIPALQGEVGGPTHNFSVLLGCQEPGLERTGSILNQFHDRGKQRKQ